MVPGREPDGAAGANLKRAGAEVAENAGAGDEGRPGGGGWAAIEIVACLGWGGFAAVCSLRNY